MRYTYILCLEECAFYTPPEKIYIKYIFLCSVYMLCLIGQKNPFFSHQILPIIKSLELFRWNKLLVYIAVIYWLLNFGKTLTFSKPQIVRRLKLNIKKWKIFIFYYKATRIPIFTIWVGAIWVCVHFSSKRCMKHGHVSFFNCETLV